jgi:hypothetical protein
MRSGKHLKAPAEAGIQTLHRSGKILSEGGDSRRTPVLIVPFPVAEAAAPAAIILTILNLHA